MGKLLLTIGLVGLCHAAYSATQHRNYLRLTEELDQLNSPHNTFLKLPQDILLQTLVCLLLSCFGIVSIASQFKQIQITSEWENKTWDNIANRTSFYSFNHRGKYLFSSSGSSLSLEEQQHITSKLLEEEQLKLEKQSQQSKIQRQQQLEHQQRILQQQNRAAQRRPSTEEEDNNEDSSDGSGSSSEDQE